MNEASQRWMKGYVFDVEYRLARFKTDMWWKDIIDNEAAPT